MYERALTEASKRVLLEVAYSLSSYREDFTLVGGWAPYFLVKDYFEHCGSVDIDLVLNPKIMPKYESIRGIVERLGFKQVEENPFRFAKLVRSLDGRAYNVELDFITEPKGVELSYPVLKIQGNLRAVVIEGSSIALKYRKLYEFGGPLPKGGNVKVQLYVADIVGILTMKALAMHRLKDKDSYDIYAVAGFHDGGPEKAAESFSKSLISKTPSKREKKLIKKALNNIEEMFASPSSPGPLAVSRFIGSDVSTDAYMRVGKFIKELKLV